MDCCAILNRAGLRLFYRTKDHNHVPAVQIGLGLYCPELGDILGQAAKQFLAFLRMHDLAAPEHDGDLDLVLFLEEALHMSALRHVVVVTDLGTQLDLLDDYRRLMLPRLLRLLLQLVLVLAVIEHPADRRVCFGSDLDEVETCLDGDVERIIAALDPYLVTFRPDEPDVLSPDSFVYPGKIPYPGLIVCDLRTPPLLGDVA